VSPLPSPEATKIRTIFWDIGGVFLTNGWDLDQRARVLAQLGVDLVEYEAKHHILNYCWERGLITARDFFQKTVLETNPQLGLTFDQLWPLVCAESKMLHPECFEILSALRRTSLYRLATLNNESRELNEYRLDAFNLRDRFDYFLCSAYLHEMKPLPGFFRAAIEISGHSPQESLFIDDKQENCAAAAALGMQAIRLESPAQLHSALAKHGIQLP